MNKTININLAGVFFHIDENAFVKLDRYLKTIESYLANEESKEEILQDIEARIAELFTESMTHEKQVINLIQVNEMIAIMGEPEAYKIDDEETSSFTTKSKTSRKLYRDIDNNYVGGVSAGLGHYLGVNTLIIRLIWIVSALFSFGATVLIYAILWAIIPAANTTAQKLDMHGEPVNLSNIEKKVKESYTKFADKVGGIDYDKYEKQTKSGITKFFDGLGEVLRALGIFISKFLGVILLIISGTVLIGLVIFLFSFGTISLFELGDFTKTDFFPLGVPYWIQVILFFLLTAIPFFYLLILSLKLLVSNLRSIGKISHITLIGIWILSIIAITTLGVKKQLESSYSGKIAEVNTLPLSQSDTLKIEMSDPLLSSEFDKYQDSLNNDPDLSRSYSVSVNLRVTEDDEVKVRVTKKSYGSSDDNARKKASLINYGYEAQNNTLELSSYFFTQSKFLNRDERVEVLVYVPKEQIIFLDEDLIGYINTRNFRNINFNTYLGYHENTWQPIDSITKTKKITTQN